MKGCTACYDLTVEVPYPTADGLQACADAYGDAGMRAVLAPMIADRTFYQAIPGLLAALPHELRSNVERMDMPRLDHCLAVMREVVGGWRHDRDLVRPAIAPTIPHHCSEEFLMGCGDFAREFDLGLHSHVQESKVQVMAGLESYGKTQTAHLSELRLLGPNFTAAHGVWFDRDDMRLLADAGASVAHNPGSNMRLGNGIADIRGMLDAGINVGIGTDGPSSSDNLNMYEAMRFASFSSKSRGPDTSAWLTTEEVFEAATLGSAKALGLQGKIGRIAAGHKADIVFIDLDHPNWMPFNDPTNQLVHVEDGTAVHSVMVAGEMRVEDHRPVGVDLARLASRVDQVRERLDAGRGESKRLCEALSPVVNEYCSCLARRAYHINRYSSGEYLPG
jgi:5-methylthioadenosine/S-adenosylhomocysteine deaminase